MARRRLAAVVLSLTVIAGGCAHLSEARPPRLKRCERTLTCPVVTTELSLERRSELAELIEARMADRTLIAVAFDGKHLRLRPECRMPGEYTWREAGMERRFDSDSAVFVVDEPYGIDGFIRAPDPRSAEFRATRRVALRSRPNPKPDHPDCAGVTHVVDGMIEGVDLDADERVDGRPMVLQLAELPSEMQPVHEEVPVDGDPPKPEFTPAQVALAVAVGLGLIVTLAVTLAPEDAF